MSTLKEAARTLEDELNEMEGSVSTRRGRKRKTETPKSEPKPRVSTRTSLTPEQVRGMADVVLNTLCRVARVPEVTDKELDNFAQNATPFLDRKLGAYLQHNADTVMFVVACTAIVGPRVQPAIAAWSTPDETENEPATAEVRDEF